MDDDDMADEDGQGEGDMEEDAVDQSASCFAAHTGVVRSCYGAFVGCDGLTPELQW